MGLYAAGRKAAKAQRREKEKLQQLQSQQVSQAQDAGLLAELTGLGELRDQGLLTEAEFAAAKTRLLRN